MDNQLIYKIAATLIPGIGDVSGKRFVSYFGSAEAVFREKRSALQKIHGLRDVTIDALSNPKDILQRAEKEVEFIEKNDIQPLFFQDPDYPRRLLQCDDSPLMLYYKGRANLNPERVVAVVGTRNITDYGKECCAQLVSDLVDDQVLVVSGLAYGVDTQAHRSSLKAGIPTGEDQHEWIVKKLREIDNITVCPHGRPVLVRFTKKHMEDLFLRD